MNFYRNKNKLSLSLTLIIIITVLLPMYALGVEVEPSMAPTNPEFIKYINSIREEDPNEVNSTNSNSVGLYGNGDMPEPFTINRSSKDNFNNIYNTRYPSKFDLRKTGRVTSVKDQGSHPSCWTFAVYGSMESNLMPDKEWDFSENNMRNKNGFDLGPTRGGNRSMSTAYMSRGDGPVLEEDDPYEFMSPTNAPIQKHLTNVLYIPDRSDSLDNELIKDALMTYGAVQTSYYSDNYYYNDSNTNYYSNDYPNETNHAVVIVGWDDDYSKSNFKVTPKGDGAFIVKNSWGEYWGDEGYFYLSYYDMNVGTRNTVYLTEDPDKYDKIYQYDPLGMVGSTGYGNDTAWGANVFTSGPEKEIISGAGFYLPSDNASYEVYLSVDHNGDLNDRKLVKSGTVSYAGYHTVDFEPEFIDPNTDFAIIIKITTPEYTYPIATEYAQGDYSSAARSNEGESYLSSNGRSWSDIGKYTSGKTSRNIALKAFTKEITDELEIFVESVELNKTELNLIEGSREVLEATVLPEDATNKNVTWESSNPGVATVDRFGLVTAIAEGEATVTVRTVDGKYTAECIVKVEELVVLVESVNLNEMEISLIEGEIKVLEAIVLPEDSTNKDLTWSSSNPSVATVRKLESAGGVIAIAEGETVITVRTVDSDHMASCKVTVSKPEPEVILVESVELNKTGLEMIEGSREALEATVFPEDATNKNVTWESSNPELATVDEFGIVTGVSEGEAVITVRTVDGDHMASCEVTVNKPEPEMILVESVELNKTGLEMIEGSREAVEATVFPEDATNKNVIWESSNPGVATVDEFGIVTAIAEGEATITVRTLDGDHIATCEVTVDSIDNWKIWDVELNVDAGKVWAIELSQSLDIETVTDKNIYVTDKDGHIISTYDYKIQGYMENFISVIPVNEYLSKQSYTLWIKDLKSKDGKKLNKNIKMDFTIK